MILKHIIIFHISCHFISILHSSLLRDDLKIARRIYQGRTVDPLTGEPLTIDDLLAAYIERKKSESDSRDELASAMRPVSGCCITCS